MSPNLPRSVMLPASVRNRRISAINLIAKAITETGLSGPNDIIGYWNTIRNYPGLFGSYNFTPEDHNGFPTAELLMSRANSAHNGAFTLAPGYT
jgi:branched-chain amino acid transport system substrate-binding protein